MSTIIETFYFFSFLMICAVFSLWGFNTTGFVVCTLVCLLPFVLWGLWRLRWYIAQIGIATAVYGYSINHQWFPNDPGGHTASVWLALFCALIFTIAVNKAVDLWRGFVFPRAKRLEPIQVAVPLENPDFPTYSADSPPVFPATVDPPTFHRDPAIYSRHENDRGQRRDSLEHEHHRIFHQRARVELRERGAVRAISLTAGRIAPVSVDGELNSFTALTVANRI